MTSPFDPSAALRQIDAHVLGFLAGVDGRVTDANDAFLRMVGHSRDELREGTVDWRILTPSEWHAGDAGVTADEGSQRGFFQPVLKSYQRRDGSRVDLLLMGATMGPAPLRWVAYVVDLTRVTDQLASRLTVAKRQRRGRVSSDVAAPGAIAHALDSVGRQAGTSALPVHAVLEHCPLGAAVINGDGEWTHVNATMRTLLDRDATDYLALGWQDLLHPDDRPEVESAVARVLSGVQTATDLEARLREHGGDWRWLAFTIASLPAGDGADGQVVLYAEDVQQAREAFDAMLRSDSALRAIAEHGDDSAAILFDTGLVCTALEGRGLRAAGLVREDGLGLRMDAVWPPEAHAHILTHLESALDGYDEQWGADRKSVV